MGARGFIELLFLFLRSHIAARATALPSAIVSTNIGNSSSSNSNGSSSSNVVATLSSSSSTSGSSLSPLSSASLLVLRDILTQRCLLDFARISNDGTGWDSLP